MHQPEDSSPEEAIEINIKKTASSKPLREKKKIVKQKGKAKSSVPANIQHLLQDKIKDEALLKQLESRPFDFGEKSSKVIKITQSTENRKQVTGLGISLVHSIKKQKRTPVNHLINLIQKTSALRKDISNVRSLKKK